jgi:thiamine-phosphate pyrophosphorylase
VRSEARIVDANLNRALEGLRVLEDIARFALGDAGTTERCKAARHELASAVRGLGLPPGLLESARDTPGDVGTGLTVAGERSRVDLGSVARAACGRAAEATRSIEEIAKVLGSGGDEFERVRYRIYDLGRAVASGLSPAGPQWRLCVLLTGSLCRGGAWESVAESAIEGGADCLQLREKTLPDREFLRRATRLVSIARGASRRVWVVINDRPDLALLSGADAVHVGQGDLTPPQVRAVCGAGMLVGMSTDSIESARAAIGMGASSIGLGPMFPSSTKPKDRIAGPAYLRAVMADESLSAVPHLCIGGITPENAGALVEAGARGLAVSSAVCGSEDPGGVCRALRGLFPADGGAVHSPHGD